MSVWKLNAIYSEKTVQASDKQNIACRPIMTCFRSHCMFSACPGAAYLARNNDVSPATLVHFYNRDTAIFVHL